MHCQEPAAKTADLKDFRAEVTDLRAEAASAKAKEVERRSLEAPAEGEGLQKYRKVQSTWLMMSTWFTPKDLLF